MNDLILIAVVTSSWLGIGYVLGLSRGHAKAYKAGRDAQWCDAHFAQIEADKARRDKTGKYKRRA